ncbi:MAG TPA: hypothetical protein EYO79_05090, partial [Candidatus Marinimicrobia bacterium]|nr:hypothetical protein [Candidatus Neomarinimicrobiota bacterium]
AAYATFVSMASLGLLRIVEVNYYIKILPFSLKLMKPVFSGGIMILVLSLLKPIVMPMHTVTSLIIITLVGLLTYFAILWLLKFDDDDREIWSGIIMITKKK